MTNTLRTATVSNNTITCTLKEQEDGNLEVHFDKTSDDTRNLFIMKSRDENHEVKMQFGDYERNGYNFIDLENGKTAIYLTIEDGTDTVHVEGDQQEAFDLVLKELQSIETTVKDQLEIEEAQLMAQDEIMTQMFGGDTEEDEYREQDDYLPDGEGMYEIGHGGLDW